MGYLQVANWPASNVWVFIAQWWSTAALTQRPWVRIPLKFRKLFAVYLQLLKLQLPLRRSYLHLIVFRMRDVRENDYSNLQSFIRGAILVPNRMDMA